MLIIPVVVELVPIVAPSDEALPAAPSAFAILGTLPVVNLVRTTLEAALRSVGGRPCVVEEAIVPLSPTRSALRWTAPGLDLCLSFDRHGEPVIVDRMLTPDS